MPLGCDRNTDFAVSPFDSCSELVRGAGRRDGYQESRRCHVNSDGSSEN